LAPGAGGWPSLRPDEIGALAKRRPVVMAISPAGVASPPRRGATNSRRLIQFAVVPQTTTTTTAPSACYCCQKLAPPASSHNATGRRDRFLHHIKLLKAYPRAQPVVLHMAM
jgi:hypothetical protein